MTPADLDNRFSYHEPDESAAHNHDAVRRLHRILAGTLNELLPEGREKSLAITKLEESLMWSNAAIARAS